MKKVLKIVFKILKTIADILLLILFTFLFLIVLINLLNNDDTLTIGDYSVYTVASESMRPVLSGGDFILTKREKEYKVGDVVTYISDDIYITHRIVKIDGDTVVTKGDANNTVDKEFNKNQIKGKYIKKLVILEIIYLIFTDKLLLILVLIVIVLIEVCAYLMDKEKEGEAGENKKE